MILRISSGKRILKGLSGSFACESAVTVDGCHPGRSILAAGHRGGARRGDRRERRRPTPSRAIRERLSLGEPDRTRCLVAAVRPGPARATSFAVVGVNGGTAANTNPCLADQLRWAFAATRNRRREGAGPVVRQHRQPRRGAGGVRGHHLADRQRRRPRIGLVPTRRRVPPQSVRSLHDDVRTATTDTPTTWPAPGSTAGTVRSNPSTTGSCRRHERPG